MCGRAQARARLREIHTGLLEEHLRQLQAQEMDVDVAKAMGWHKEAAQVPTAPLINLLPFALFDVSGL